MVDRVFDLVPNLSLLFSRAALIHSGRALVHRRPSMHQNHSDAGADAYTHAAIDQAWRAVNELLGAVQGNDIS